MIDHFVKAWDSNTGRLKKYIATHKQTEYDTYKKLTKILFVVVINPYYLAHEDQTWWGHGMCDIFDLKSLVEVEGGEYQGTLLFIIPCPTGGALDQGNEFVITGVDYGSCSGCDTLMGIISEGDSNEPPTESQLHDYMLLLLHLLQHCKYFPEEDVSFDYEETDAQYQNYNKQ